MTAAASGIFKHAFRELEDLGLLLQTDKRFPNVVALVVGEPVRGSWWGHPQGGLIYAVLNELHAHPDVTALKLLSGKVTLVHRPLWPAVLSVAAAGANWQLVNLSGEARELLAKVERDGELQTDWLVEVSGYESKALTGLVNQLEKRLLMASESFHTERGRHARRLQSWARWAARHDMEMGELREAEARADLERVVGVVNEKYGARARLPWA